MEDVERLEIDGYTIEVFRDDCPINPREDYDHSTRMVCFHKRYTLGDKHNIDHEQFDGWDEMEAHIRKELGGVVVLPLFMFDHSGLTISTKPFSCPWDSGRIGFIYMTKQDVLDVYGGKRLTESRIKRATNLMEGEVEEYDNYVKGDVFSFRILKGDNEVDSCCGFYGIDNAIENAKQQVKDMAIKS